LAARGPPPPPPPPFGRAALPVAGGPFRAEAGAYLASCVVDVRPPWPARKSARRAARRWHMLWAMPRPLCVRQLADSPRPGAARRAGGSLCLRLAMQLGQTRRKASEPLRRRRAGGRRAGQGGEGAGAAQGREGGLLRRARRLPGVQALPGCAPAPAGPLRGAWHCSCGRRLLGRPVSRGSGAVDGTGPESGGPAGCVWTGEPRTKGHALRTLRRRRAPSLPEADAEAPAASGPARAQAIEAGRNEGARDQAMRRGLKVAATDAARSKLARRPS